MFTAHAFKLMEVARLAVSASGAGAEVRRVTEAAERLGERHMEVITALTSLAASPERLEAGERVEAVRGSWHEAVRVLTEAVDNIVTIDDFLTVSESHDDDGDW